MLATGVTPDEVRRAARIVFDQHIAESGEATTWEDWLSSTHKKRGNSWVGMLPDNPDRIYDEDYGDDADLLRRVAAVVQAVLRPPV